MTTTTFNFEFKLVTCNVDHKTVVPVTGTFPTGFDVGVEVIPSFENIYKIEVTSDAEVSSVTGTFSYKKKGDCKYKSKTFTFVIIDEPFDIEGKSMVFPDAKCGGKVKVTIKAVLA